MDGESELKSTSKMPKDNRFISNNPPKTETCLLVVSIDESGYRKYYEVLTSHKALGKQSHDTDSKSEEEHGSNHDIDDELVQKIQEILRTKFKAAKVRIFIKEESHYHMQECFDEREAWNEIDTLGNSREERVTNRQHKCSLNNAPAMEMTELIRTVETTLDSSDEYEDDALLIVKPWLNIENNHLLSYLYQYGKLYINYKSFALGFLLGMQMLTLVYFLYVTIFKPRQVDTNSVINVVRQCFGAIFRFMKG